MPDELLASHGIINEARPEDELAEPPAAFSPVDEQDQSESIKSKPYKKLKGKASLEPNSLEAVATTTEVPQQLDGRRPNQTLEGPQVAIAEPSTGGRPDPKVGAWMGIALTSSRPEDRRQAHMEQRLYEARRRILSNASEALGALGEEMIPATSGETGAPSTWEVVAVPAMELPVPELPDDLIGADRVTRVKDSRGESYVAWFLRCLKGYSKGEIQGRNEPIREGARSI